MKICIVTVGKLSQSDYLALCNLYQGRIAHYLPIERMSVRDEKIKNRPEREIVGREAERILERIRPADYTVALERTGEMISSPGLAAFVQERILQGVQRLVFMVGGPLGLGDKVLTRADYKLSLSKMTFPHECTTALLMEQLYRALTIMRGEKYHK